MSMNVTQKREVLLSIIRAGGRPEYVLFWGRFGPEQVLSQWHHSPFTIDGVEYVTAEHWMMAEKARTFGDHDALASIMGSPHPDAAKRAGRLVRGYVDAVWSEKSYGVVARGSYEKFRQNPAEQAYLLSTGDKILVEASPYDRVWGVGRGPGDPLAADPSSWLGENRLGFALMDARDAIEHGRSIP